MTSESKNTGSKFEIKHNLGYIIPFLLTGLFLYLAFRNMDLGEVFYLLSRTSVFWLIIFIISFVVSHIVRAYRWKIMIIAAKPNVSVLNLFGATMIGYGVNCIIPRLGEIYRGLFLGKWENLSRTSMIGTIVIERVIDVLTLGIAVLISIMIFPGDLLKEIPWLKSTVYFGFAVLIGIIVVIYLLVKMKEKFYSGIVNFFGRFSEKFASKLAYIFESLVEGFNSIKGVKNYLLTIILSSAILLLYALGAYIGFYMIGMDKFANISFASAWILMTIGAFGVIIPTPGGMGSYHAITIAVLTLLLGVDKELSAAYAVLTHSISYIIFIMSPPLFLFIINRKRRLMGEKKETIFSVFKMKFED